MSAPAGSRSSPGDCWCGSAALVAALFLALTGAVASRMVDQARAEAARIRTANTQEIAEARRRRSRLAGSRRSVGKPRGRADRRDRGNGCRFGAARADRDAARADLEHFAELRQQIGFDLVPYRDRVVIVVPEGETITRWSAPGLSDLSRYNGRMFRVVRNFEQFWWRKDSTREQTGKTLLIFSCYR